MNKIGFRSLLLSFLLSGCGWFDLEPGPRERRLCIAECNEHWDRLNHSPQFQIPYQSCLNACVGQATAFMGIVAAPDGGAP